jgi:tetratricopeptide (TPR) repeat protein
MDSLKRYGELGVCCNSIITLDNTSEQKMTKARLLLKMHMLDELLEWLDVLGPSDIAAWERHYLKARAYAGMEQPLKAISELEEARKNNPPGEVIILQAEILAELGKEAEAMACLAVPNPDAAVLKARGEVQLRFRRYNDATESFSKSLGIDSRSLPVWYGKGMAHLGNGEPDEALGCFDMALGLDQDYVWAWAGKVRAYRAKKDEKNAARAEAILSKIDENFRIE